MKLFFYNLVIFATLTWYGDTLASPPGKVPAEAAGFVGCWALKVGPYVPELNLGGDAVYIIPPTALHFHAEQIAPWDAEGLGLSVPSDATAGPLKTGYWQPVSHTTVSAHLLDGFTQIGFLLTLHDGRLEGHVTPKWDFGGRAQRAAVTGTRRSCQVGGAQPITEMEAVKRAQEFVVQNGYTDAPAEKLKAVLDNESLQYGDGRDAILKLRFNSLKREAIGAKKGAKGRDGWSVAFDYVYPSAFDCRVVTMNEDGSGLRKEHVEGRREAFVGFSK